MSVWFDKDKKNKHNKNMKRLLLVFCFVFLFLVIPQPQTEVSFAEEKQVIVNTSYTYLYKTEDFLEHYDFKINANEILVCIDESENYYKVNYTFNETLYTGYISYEIASIYTPPQDVILVYNGKILKETEVFEVTNDNIIEGVILKPGDQIYLYEGFDSKKEFTNIKFKYEDKVYVGRIPTTNLSPNGLNKAVIIALGMIVAFVGIVLILLGFKKKKWHTKLKFKKK